MQWGRLGKFTKFYIPTNKTFFIVFKTAPFAVGVLIFSNT